MVMLCLIDIVAVISAVFGIIVAFKKDEKKFAFNEEF